MKVCFPVQQDQGMQSIVFNHFGSAPSFVIVDAESGTASSVINRDLHHSHGACNPIKALGDQKVDAVIVGGIGAGALSKLNQLGIKVYRAQRQTVSENLELLLSRELSEYSLQGCCGGHGGTCAH